MISNTYPGGKGGAGTYQKIINLMPPHRTYIEPCLGKGAILRKKKPAKHNIGSDIDIKSIEYFKKIGMYEKEGFQFYNSDVIKLLDFITAREYMLFYFDPPYLMETRKQKRKIYDYEFTRDDHIELLNKIKWLNSMVMISGYSSDLYNNFLSDWNKKEFEVVTRGGGMATECLWYNFPDPIQLHDYKYLGNNFRERERIKKKTERWVKNLKKMPVLERKSILSAIYEEMESDFPFK